MAIIGKSNGKGSSDGMDIPANLRRAPAGQPSYEELLAQVQALQAKVAAKNTLRLKVSEKGAVSLYGLGRFPITLYASAWLRVLDMAEEIREFVESNKASLSFKE
jgi:hypothetical protein